MDHEVSHRLLVSAVAAIAGGVTLTAVARRVGLPSIVMLLAGGVLLGPVGLGVVDPDAFGVGLRAIVSLLIGVILFEGGLTLDLAEYRQAPAAIVRLLTIGVLITWFGTAAIIWAWADIPILYAIVAASLVIVTGPTVVAPLLRRIHVAERVSAILRWESVLIDPLGVFIALLCFEAIVQGDGTFALVDFGLRVTAGLGVGLVGGIAIERVLHWQLVPDDMVNVFILGWAVLVFGVGEWAASEAGLLSVTTAGFLVGARRPPHLDSIRTFKGELTELSIGVLFVLLTARLQVDQFVEFGLSGLVLVAAVMVLVRPIAVWISMLGLDLTWREKTFLSWVAPRGVVAASMASLVALSIEQVGRGPDPRFVESFTYAVIVSTIVVQGLSAGFLARQLGLVMGPPRRWLIIGAHALGQRLAHFLDEHAPGGIALLDTGRADVRAARRAGLPAYAADARDLDRIERTLALADIGHVVAITDNEELNVAICQRWRRRCRPDHLFRWQCTAERRATLPGQPVWRGLPRPSAVGFELDRGESSVRQGKVGEADAGAGETVLVSFSSGDAVFDAPPDSAPESSAAALILTRESFRSAVPWRPDVSMRLAIAPTDELLTMAVTRLSHSVAHLPIAGLVAELIEREEVLSSALGGGIALPHAQVPDLRDRLTAVAYVPRGVDWPGAPDDIPVDLIVLLLSPEGDPSAHLAALADIARVLIDDSRRFDLIAGCERDATDQGGRETS